MGRIRTSFPIALAVLALSAGCGWWFSRAFFHQLAQACTGLGR